MKRRGCAGVLLLVALLWGSIRGSQGQQKGVFNITDYQHNTGEFEILCKIYRITQAKVPRPEFRNREKEDEIMKRFEVMVSEARASGKETSVSQKAREGIEKLYKRAKTVKGEIDRNRRRAMRESSKAEESMMKAVYGDLVDEAYKTNRPIDDIMETNKSLLFNSNESALESCGSNGNETGKTLVNDFFCVCVGEAKDEANSSSYYYNGHSSPCRTYLRRPEKNKWTGMSNECALAEEKCEVNSSMTLKDAWQVVKRGCVYRHIACNSKLLKAALEEFDKFVNMKQDKFQVEGVFGHVNDTSKETFLCDGHRPGTTCVNYKHTLSRGGIPWHNRLTNATKNMEDMEKYESEANSHIYELEDLEHDAEEIFLEYKLGGSVDIWGKAENVDVDTEGVVHFYLMMSIFVLLAFS
ncbi:expression site-associated gene 2 (ESAG2) protein, putative [Trypanosoma equiperdum]|uniref:Expression site-associated gene 2 (ESAG2) protein, putative n=1 Tax=Trypanosoma equiperdum TaxID=5694 RepID=A0A1G4IBT9_TRYEQ|nr:expression site-associated gene 2 (ESAG2) protein, putative [Trypanosoma equiperdum]